MSRAQHPPSGPSQPVARAAVLGAAALLATACGTAERSAPARNVLLISLDSVRRDLLSCYGGGSPHAPGVATSPALDGLAAEGVRMDEAYATTSWTLPSHLSLLTGHPELVHGVDLDWDRIAPDCALLAEILAAAGFRTSGFFSGPYLEPSFGLGRGFERYERCYGPALSRAAEEEAAARGGGYRPGSPSRQLEHLAHRDQSSAAVADRVLEELAAAAGDGRRWFVFAHFFDPHYDYQPPAPWDRRFDPDYAGEIDGRDFLTNPAVSEPDPEDPTRRLRRISDRDLEHVLALYGGELAWTDAQIARILARLEELGQAEDTLVVVTSDHGDEFFEAGGIGHRHTLREELLRVPMILRLPGALPAGAAVSGPVSNADVVPTVLELLGVDGPPTTGTSFLPLVRGQSAERPGVYGRLVTMRPTRMRLAGELYAARWLSVGEVFRTGSIKVRRRRSWGEASQGLPVGVQKLYRRLQAKMYATEELEWIDLGLHPGAPEGRYSSDFSDPRARAALDAFRREHARLTAARREKERAASDPAMRAELEALGYAVATGAPLEREGVARLAPAGGERGANGAEDPGATSREGS